MIRRVLLWGASLFFGLQMFVIGVLLAIDFRRQRRHPQGRFPRSRPESVGVGSSEIHLYTYGEDLYNDMLTAIRQARERILLETFIWKGDKVGEQFKQELFKAAVRGVEVYVIFDSFANLVVPTSFKRFEPPFHVIEYPIFSHPWNPFLLRSYARDHRKILVVDGDIAFVGGYNIGSLYETEWRDTHVRITGPDAWEVENVFIDFWNEHRDESLPKLPDVGTRDWDPRIAVHRNDPQMMIFPIRTTYLEAIDRARHHIYMTHAYFIPDRIILHALCAAAQRGVEVRILLPATSNHIIADWLARGYYTHCLRNNIHLMLYQDAMVHAKTATIDGEWSTIGTTNMDRLSLVGNFEVNVEIYDTDLATQMEEIFYKDCTNATELTLEEWCKRSLIKRFAEAILMPLRPFL